MREREAVAVLTGQAEAIKALGATSLYLFGSTVPDDARPDSDIDLLIDFNVTNLWRRVVNWRGQKGKVTWQRMTVLRDRRLPRPCITHPWLSRRFAVKHPRWEPGAGIPPAGICAGGVR
jgi:predicted nucleotidyltransferase